MQNYVDDSELVKILQEGKQLMAGISGEQEMSGKEMLERARNMAAATSEFTGPEGSSKPHCVEGKARIIKSKIGKHMDMLKRTASNISLVKERIHASGDKKVSNLKKIEEIPEIYGKNLSEYSQKIDKTLKELSKGTKGKSKIEEKIQKYRNIIGEVDGTLKRLPPKLAKEGKINFQKVIPKPIDLKLEKKVEEKEKAVMNQVCDFEPGEDLEIPFADYDSDDSQREGVGEWIKYEGFNCQEDLDKFNQILKDFVGESPDEYMKKNKNRELEMDDKGNPIFKGKPIIKKNLFNSETRQVDAISKSEESERRLRDVLSRAGTGKGDFTTNSLLSEKKYLENYMDRKLNDTVQPVENVSTKVPEQPEKKKEPAVRRNTKSKKSTRVKESKLSSVETTNKVSVTEETIPKEIEKQLNEYYMKKIGRKPDFGARYVSETTMDSEAFDIPRPNMEEGNDMGSIQWDLERIKRLILKERQDHLRKKRDAWEKNNELSEELLEREEYRAINKELNLGKPKQSGFDFPIPQSKPNPEDFITRYKEQDKLYKKALKDRGEEVYLKEDLNYESGVNSFYNDKSKNKKSNTSTSHLRGHPGVRKKK